MAAAAGDAGLGAMLVVTDANFEADVCRSAVPVLLHVWTPRCKACAQVKRELHKLAASVRGKVVIATANRDECRSLPKRLGILFLPTLVLFVDGGEVARLSGVPTSDELSDLLRMAGHDCSCGPAGHQSNQTHHPRQPKAAGPHEV